MTPPEPQGHTSRALMGWLWRDYLSHHLWILLAAVFFMALEGAMLGLLSWLMKPMFDRVFVGGERDLITWLGIAFLAIFLVRGLSSMAQKWLLAQLSQDTLAALRLDLVRHLLRLDGAFHQVHGPGYLTQRVEPDVAQIQTVWTAIITGAGRDLVAVVVLLGVAIGIDWKWTLVACLGAPLLVVPSMLVQRYVRANSRAARDTGAGLGTRLNEMFHNILPIKLNRLEEHQARAYERLTRARVATEVRAAVGQAAIPGLIDIMSGVGFMAVLIYGGAQIVDGDKTVGDFMAFFTAIGLAFEPLRRLGAITGVWQAAAASMERVRALLLERPGITSPGNPVPVPPGVPELALRDVHLSYGTAPVLRGLNLTAPAGKTTALVGPSGAGKSTVLHLLTRLVDPDQGEVTLGGEAVERLDLASLRAQISVVSQDALLFDDSLRENILLGREDVTEARLAEVIEAANLSDFVDRAPDGLDTRVGPRGSALSGGQRQRVAIARALLRDTPVLLLDEATSALDAQSEAAVQDALERLSRGRTTLVIAHRLSTVRHADRIVVMEQGRVSAEGRHAELVRAGGTYADLWRMQAGQN